MKTAVRKAKAKVKKPVLGPMVAFIPSHDLNRSRFFYTKIMDFRAKGEDAFALVLDAYGTMIRVVSLQGFKPATYTLLDWMVPDIKKAGTALRKKRVLFLRFEGMKQDALGIWKAPGGELVAWFKDPDGNVLSLTQSV